MIDIEKEFQDALDSTAKTKASPIAARQLADELLSARKRFDENYRIYSRDGGRWALEQSGLPGAIDKVKQTLPGLEIQAEQDLQNKKPTEVQKVEQKANEKILLNELTNPEPDPQKIVDAKMALSGRTPVKFDTTPAYSFRPGLFGGTVTPNTPPAPAQPSGVPAIPMSAPKPLLYITGNDGYNTATADEVDAALNKKFGLGAPAAPALKLTPATKAQLANKIALQHPDWTKQQIIDYVNQQQ